MFGPQILLRKLKGINLDGQITKKEVWENFY